MTREDLLGHYQRYYVPNNATLVVVGDVDAAAVIRLVAQRFGGIAPREVGKRLATREPEQLGERRVTIAREGTTAYFRAGFHAPAAADPDFVPLLVLDAVLSGAKGVNLWASFRTPPPQRSTRLYQALVNRGLASSVTGSIVPTHEPFLYTLSATATEGTALDRIEAVIVAEVDRVRASGITPEELRKAKHQLRARMVFEQDSITNIAHQLGYFATIDRWDWYPALAARVEGVSLDDVGRVAARYLGPANRTIGWFQPLPPGAGAGIPSGQGAGAGPASARRRGARGTMVGPRTR
jgi:zinc protease